MLDDSLRKQSVNYFRSYHRARLDELRMFLDNEGWEACPVKSGFNLLMLQVCVAASLTRGVAAARHRCRASSLPRGIDLLCRHNTVNVLPCVYCVISLLCIYCACFVALLLCVTLCHSVFHTPVLSVHGRNSNF